MKNVKIQLTPEELTLLTSLTADQLFRREFIDPKMPGHKGNAGELAMGKDILGRLRAVAREAAGPTVGGPVSKRAPNQLARNANGISNGV
jgi:hypothetical protein